MKKVNFLIFVTTILLFVYVTLCHYETQIQLILLFFVLLHGFYFYMIYCILRFGQPSSKVFDEQMYEDYKGW